MSRFVKRSANVAAVACLLGSLFVASQARAFTRTITDIEDPAVTAKVLQLDAAAERYWSADYNFLLEGRSLLLSSLDWGHSLSGATDSSLSEGQMPKVIIGRDPFSVKVEGKVVTDEAQGAEHYWDFERCTGNRVTTKSPLLDVELDGFYQLGSSTSRGNPEVRLETENLDPWIDSCGMLSSGPQATLIKSFSSLDTTSVMINGSYISQRWIPGEGSLTITRDGCTEEFCDFTIMGSNKDSGQITDGYSGSGSLFTSFHLQLRLEYPEVPVTAPDTIITKHPKKVIKTKNGKAKVTFKFRSTGPVGMRFRCRLDDRTYFPCTSKFTRRVGRGKHRFEVTSTYQGKADESPAVYLWRVKKLKKR